MSGFLPRLFGKGQFPSETSRRMHEMQDYKKAQYIAKLETELKASKGKVDELHGKLEAMKIVLEKKDTALDDITRDREKVSLELKNEDLCNKYMKEQLEKRLKALEKDKQKFLIQKSNFQTKKELMLGQITIEDSEQYPKTIEGCSEKITSLQKYTQSLLATLLEREKTISTLCEKFLLLKFKRTQSEAQFKGLKEEYDEISSDLLRKLEDARNEINMIADTKYQDPMDKKNFALVQMVQKNGALILENSTLKLEISQLKQSITSLKLENSLIDINTRTLEMRSVRSNHTLNPPGRRHPYEYSTKSSDINSRRTLTYQRSLNTESNVPTRTYSSCASHRSAPSSTLTYPPKRRSNLPYVTQEHDGDTSRGQPTASESKNTSLRCNKTCNINRRKDTLPSSRSQDKRKKSRRKRETKQYSSDSSGRETLPVSRTSGVTNRLLSELHPAMPISRNSEESVDFQKARRHERQRRVKSVTYEDQAQSTTSRQDEEIEDGSLESIYSAIYLSPTRSTPGRVETAVFVKDEKADNRMVSNNVVEERPKYTNTKCN